MATLAPTQVDMGQKSSPVKRSFENFFEAIRDDETPTVSPRRYVSELQTDLQTLADHAGVHRNTLTRSPESSDVQEYLRASLRVIRAATDVSGDVDKAIYWYLNEPLPPFEYRSAEFLVSKGRTDDVIRFLMSLNAGASG